MESETGDENWGLTGFCDFRLKGQRPYFPLLPALQHGSYMRPTGAAHGAYGQS
jgi:hypothetical protein